MSFIKEKPFVAVVGALTLVAAGGLGYFITMQNSRYDTALQDYEDAQTDDSQYRKMDLFPSKENQQKKKEAVENYEAELAAVKESMSSYVPTSIIDVTSDKFTTRLKAESDKLRSEFEAVGTELPDRFGLGFESYLTKLPRQEATGELGYQLDASTWLLGELVKARPTALKNIKRKSLSVENNGEPLPDGINRMEYELTFEGTEKTLRSLLSSIGNAKNYLFEITAIRIANEKATPPEQGDVEFVRIEAEEAAAAAEEEENTGGGFVIPGQAPAEPEPEVAAPVEQEGGEMILSQILGEEKITVYLGLELVVLPPAAQASN